ncbi:pro-resilin-like [Penaeus vannamei]|uniref:pro-resilin-like n=1 Tax=Penaeus vannamei TaxID=6689 RepID=UPI00387F73AE
MNSVNMKVAVVVLSLAALARAAPQEGYNYPTPGIQGLPLAGSGSASGQFSSGSGFGQDQYPSVPAQYAFQWDVNDAPSGNFFGHGEQRDNDNTQGKYYVQLPDGRRLVVEYYVDGAGYHPTVSFEGEITAGGQGQYGQGQGGGSGQFGRGQGGGQGQGGSGAGAGQGQGYPPSGPGPSPGLPLPSQSYGQPAK